MPINPGDPRPRRPELDLVSVAFGDFGDPHRNRVRLGLDIPSHPTIASAFVYLTADEARTIARRLITRAEQVEGTRPRGLSYPGGADLAGWYGPTPEPR